MAELTSSRVIKFNTHGNGEYFIDYMKEETGLKLHLQQVIFLNVPLRRIVDHIFKILILTREFRKAQNSCFMELCHVFRKISSLRCHIIILNLQPRVQMQSFSPKAISLWAYNNLFYYFIILVFSSVLKITL